MLESRFVQYNSDISMFSSLTRCANSQISSSLILCSKGPCARVLWQWSYGLTEVSYINAILFVNIASLLVFTKYNPIMLTRTNWCKIFNILKPRQNGRRFADDTFKRIFVNHHVLISIKISQFIPNGPMNNVAALIQIMTCGRPGDKPVFEPMMGR